MQLIVCISSFGFSTYNELSPDEGTSGESCRPVNVSLDQLRKGAQSLMHSGFQLEQEGLAGGTQD